VFAGTFGRPDAQALSSTRMRKDTHRHKKGEERERATRTGKEGGKEAGDWLRRAGTRPQWIWTRARAAVAVSPHVGYERVWASGPSSISRALASFVPSVFVSLRFIPHPPQTPPRKPTLFSICLLPISLMARHLRSRRTRRPARRRFFVHRAQATGAVFSRALKLGLLVWVGKS
jgi:hypothetical protein